MRLSDYRKTPLGDVFMNEQNVEISSVLGTLKSLVTENNSPKVEIEKPTVMRDKRETKIS